MTILIIGIIHIMLLSLIGYTIYKDEKRHKMTLDIINGYGTIINAIEHKDYNTIKYYIDLYEKSDGIVDDHIANTLKDYILFALNEIERIEKAEKEVKE
jgi:hypothetical protein